MDPPSSTAGTDSESREVSFYPATVLRFLTLSFDIAVICIICAPSSRPYFWSTDGLKFILGVCIASLIANVYHLFFSVIITAGVVGMPDIGMGFSVRGASDDQEWRVVLSVPKGHPPSPVSLFIDANLIILMIPALSFYNQYPHDQLPIGRAVLVLGILIL